MKILFIHFSDSHFEHIKDANNLLLTPIIDSFNNLSFEKAILVFSGDMSQQGLQDELDSFSNFLYNFSRLFETKFGKKIDSIIIPGNHDVALKKEWTSETFCSLTTNDDYLNLFNQYIVNMQPALALCKNFNNEKSAVSQERIKYENADIGFTLINSAPFSTLRKEDKGHHYLPKNDCNTLETRFFPSLYSFFVCHHRPDWFDEKSSSVLNKYINDSVSICFFGHEHETAATYISREEDELIISCGGELILEDNQIVGSFNSLLIETESNACYLFSHQYSKKMKTFLRTQRDGKKPIRVRTFEKIFKMKNAYIEKTFMFEEIGRKFDSRKLFVMPYLKSSSSSTEDISDFESLVSIIEDIKTLSISGPPSSGKTTCLLNLLDYFSNKKICVYFSVDDAHTGNCEQCIKQAFQDMYGVDEDLYKLFMQKPIAEKMILFDRIDDLPSKSSKSKYLEYLYSNFGYIITTSQSNIEDTFREIENKPLVNFRSYLCTGFSIRQKEQLVKNICHSCEIGDIETITQISHSVHSSLSMSSVLDYSDPLIILLLTCKIIDDKLYLERNTSDAFSIVFTHNINNLLLIDGKKEYLESYLIVLGRLAFKVLQKKESILFCDADIYESIKEAKEEYGNIDLDNLSTINTFLKSTIIKRTGKANTYRFHHNSYLAFFASNAIVYLYNTGEVEVLNEIMDNITFGLNGDVFLFAIYSLKRVSVVLEMQSRLTSALNGIPELDFDEKNNLILKRVTKYLPETPKQAENKKQLINRLDKTERKQIISIDEDESNVFEKDESESYHLVLQKAMKLIELSAKAISGFRSEINRRMRDELLSSALSSLFKVLYQTFDISKEDADAFEEAFDELKEKISNEAQANPKIKKLSIEINEMDFPAFMHDRITTTTLNILTSIAQIMVSDASTPFIKRINSEKFLYKLFQLICYERLGREELFIPCLEKMCVRGTCVEYLLIIRRIVRMFVIRNNVSNSSLAKIGRLTGYSMKNLILLNTNKDL